MLDPRIQGLRDRLGRHRASAHDAPPGTPQASVALLVRPDASDLELLLIRRAVAPGDPWSGHMALPGGRRAPTDDDELDTAIRETGEEVGIDLRHAGTPLGRLDPVFPRGAAPPIVVSPFVFSVPAGAGTVANHEVDVAVWIPLRELVRPGAATEYLHALGSGEHLRFPALGYREYVIWGLTHRILTQFLELAAINVQQGERSE